MNVKQNTADVIIQKFGGQSALARLLHKRQSTIQHWSSTGVIPSKWQPVLLRLARERGINLQPSDFIQTEPANRFGPLVPFAPETTNFESAPVGPFAPVIQPGEYMHHLRQASMGNLVLCFVGVGSAFAKRNDQTSLIVAKNGVTMLVDCGTTIPQALYRHGISVTDFDYYHFTHSHADHIGGVEEVLLLHRYTLKRKPKVIVTPTYQRVLWEESLKGGAEINEDGMLRFVDLVDVIAPEWVASQPREMYRINIEGINLDIFRTIHTPGSVTRWDRAFWSTGLMVDRKTLFTADTRFDPTLFTDLDLSRVDTIFHDCQLSSPGTVHASYDELKTLPERIRSMMYLTHYNDNFEDFDPIEDGFRGFAKPFELYTWKS